MNYGIDTIKHLAFVNALTESATPAEANRSTLILEVASRTALSLEEAEFAKTAKAHLVKNWKKYAAGAALAGAAGGAVALQGTGAKTAVVNAVSGAASDASYAARKLTGNLTQDEKQAILDKEAVKRQEAADLKNAENNPNSTSDQDKIDYGHGA